MEIIKSFFTAIRNPVFIIIILSAYSCNRDYKASIKIHVPEYANTMTVVEEQRITGVKYLDSLYFSSMGKAHFRFELEQPTFYNIKFDNRKDFYLILHPKDKVKISGSEDNLIITGSDESQKLMMLYDSLFATRKVLMQINDDFESESNLEAKKLLSEEYKRILKAYKRFSTGIILDNLNSFVGLAALYQEIDHNVYLFSSKSDIQFYKLVSDSLSAIYPKHRHVLTLKRNYKKIIDTYNMHKLLANVDNINEALPELILPSINGDSVSLSSMQNQYVLLNFWDAKTSYNKTYFPKLKRVHSKYSNKGFGIYNVYVDKSIETWKKMIYFEEIGSFTNVADTNFPYSSTKTLFNVSSLPQNYLIDVKNITILEKNITSEQLDKSLSIKLN